VPVLAQHLNHPDPLQHLEACAALAGVLRWGTAAAARELAAQPGSLEALVLTLRRRCRPEHGARWCVATIMWRLAQPQQGLAAGLVAAGAVPALVPMLSAPGEVQKGGLKDQLPGMAALPATTHQRRQAQEQMLEAGGLAALAALPADPPSRSHEMHATELVAMLTQPGGARAKAALEAGVLPGLCTVARRHAPPGDVVMDGAPLVLLLKSRRREAHKGEGEHLLALLAGCRHTRDEVVDAGAVAVLVQVGPQREGGGGACRAAAQAVVVIGGQALDARGRWSSRLLRAWAAPLPAPCRADAGRVQGRPREERGTGRAGAGVRGGRGAGAGSFGAAGAWRGAGP
jgi:hypothetical protein